MNTNEKREQKTPMKFVELVKTKTENHGPLTHSHALVFICIMSVFCQ